MKKSSVIILLLLFVIPAKYSVSSEYYSSVPPATISDDLCEEIRKYFVRIDEVRETEDLSKREELYAQAKAKLDPWLEGKNALALGKEIFEYARYAELINSGDPTKPEFLGYVEKYQQIRSSILNRCNSFTFGK